MKHVSIYVSLLLLASSCGTIDNPFAKKDKASAGGPPEIEIVSTEESVGGIAAVLVETTDTAPQIGAYLTTGEGQQQNLQLVDVQKPDTPFQVGNTIQGQVRKAIIHENILYVLDGAHSIAAYSLSDRANPVKIATVELPVSREVIYDFTLVAERGRLYFSTELNGLQTAKVDLNQKLWPSEGVALPPALSGPFNFLNAVGAHLSISDLRSENLFFLQLNDDHHGDIASSYSSGGRIFRVRSHGQQIFICDVETGLHKLDLADLNQPNLLYNLKPAGITRDVVELENFVIVAADSQGRKLGIEIYKKEADGSLREYRRKETPGVVTSLQQVGDLIYAVDNFEGSSTLMIVRLNL